MLKFFILAFLHATSSDTLQFGSSLVALQPCGSDGNGGCAQEGPDEAVRPVLVTGVETGTHHPCAEYAPNPWMAPEDCTCPENHFIELLHVGTHRQGWGCVSMETGMSESEENSSLANDYIMDDKLTVMEEPVKSGSGMETGLSESEESPSQAARVNDYIMDDKLTVMEDPEPEQSGSGIQSGDTEGDENSGDEILSGNIALSGGENVEETSGDVVLEVEEEESGSGVSSGADVESSPTSSWDIRLIKHSTDSQEDPVEVEPMEAAALTQPTSTWTAAVAIGGGLCLLVMITGASCYIKNRTRRRVTKRTPSLLETQPRHPFTARSTFGTRTPDGGALQSGNIAISLEDQLGVYRRSIGEYDMAAAWAQADVLDGGRRSSSNRHSPSNPLQGKLSMFIPGEVSDTDGPFSDRTLSDSTCVSIDSTHDHKRNSASRGVTMVVRSPGPQKL